MGNRCEVRRASTDLVYRTVVAYRVSKTGYLDHSFRQIIRGGSPIGGNPEGDGLRRRLRTEPVLVGAKNECRSCRCAVIGDICRHIVYARKFIRRMEKSVILHADVIARTED